MTERPILFSGPMVNATRERRKTQTRRVMNPQPVFDVLNLGGVDKPQVTLAPCHWTGGWCRVTDQGTCDCKEGAGRCWKCPYGVPGDRLWVREALRWERGGSEVIHGVEHRDPATLLYAADNLPVTGGSREQYEAWAKACKRDLIPSIHMPRWACRLVLEVVDVRVERVQSISEEDAIAEGVLPRDQWPSNLAAVMSSEPLREHYGKAARGLFPELWESINGKGSWAANPWVWAITFKQVEVAQCAS